MRRRRDVGRAPRAGDDRRVRRLSVSVLRARSGDAVEGAGRRTARRSSVSCSRICRSRSTPNARPAAEAAEGVRALGGNAAFWQFTRSAFAGAEGARAGGVRASGRRTPASTRRRSRRANTAWGAKIAARSRQLAEKIGVDGTPTFLVNGEVVDGRAAARGVRASRERRAQEGPGCSRSRRHGRATRSTRRCSESNLKEEAAERGEATARKRRSPTRTSTRSRSGRARCSATKDALVTIVEFSDFQCPYCKARRRDARSRSATKYGKDVRLVWKNEPAPLPPARRAGRGARARGARGEGRRGVLGGARRALRFAGQARRRATSPRSRAT